VGLPITLSELPARISAGVFILNSGLGKRGADDATATGMHGFASGTYPFLRSVPPQQFVQGLATAEIVLGAALLTPFVPTAVAGAALTAFSGGLLGLYLRTPGMRKDGSLAPTPEGLAIAKDSWLLGIGLSILTRGLVDRTPRVSVKKAEKRADRRARSAARAARASARRRAQRG
jgi:uncharacterized membrane protein YphA (DoxX/SURF4 family)